MELPDTLIEKLKHAAERKLSEPDLFGENPDDAYDWGINRGHTELAREILESLNIEYTIEDDDDERH